MSASIWGATAVLAVSSVLYLLLVLTGSTFAGVRASVGLAVRNGDSGPSGRVAGRYRPATAALAYVASLATLIAATVALVKLFDSSLGASEGGLTAPQLAASAGIAALGAMGLDMTAIEIESVSPGHLVKDFLSRDRKLMHTIGSV